MSAVQLAASIGAAHEQLRQAEAVLSRLSSPHNNRPSKAELIFAGELVKGASASLVRSWGHYERLFPAEAAWPGEPA